MKKYIGQLYGVQLILKGEKDEVKFAEEKINKIFSNTEKTDEELKEEVSQFYLSNNIKEKKL